MFSFSKWIFSTFKTRIFFNTLSVPLFLFGHSTLCSLVLWAPHCITLRNMQHAFGTAGDLSRPNWHKSYAAAIIAKGHIDDVFDQAGVPCLALNFNPVLQIFWSPILPSKINIYPLNTVSLQGEWNLKKNHLSKGKVMPVGKKKSLLCDNYGQGQFCSYKSSLLHPISDCAKWTVWLYDSGPDFVDNQLNKMDKFTRVRPFITRRNKNYIHL